MLIRSLIVLLLIATGLAHAESEQSVTLNDCIQRALRFNLDLRIAKGEPGIAESEWREARADYYDPILTFGSERSSDTQPGGIDAQNRAFAGSDTLTDNLSGSILGRTPTGATFGVRSFLNDSEGTNLGGAFTNANGGLFAEVRQPLLRNLLVDGDRLTIQLLRANIQVSEAVLQNDIMRLVGLVEAAYLDLIAARANLTVRKEAEALAAKILDGDRKRIAATTLAPNDAKQSEAQLEARKVGVLQARQSVYVAENTLKGLFTDDFAAWRDVRLVPNQKLTFAASTNLDIRASWERGLANRPDLKQAELELEKQGLVLRHAKQARLPSLDLVGRYGLAGSGTDTAAVREGIEDSSGPSWSVGLEVSFPLTNRRAREAAKAAQLRLRQQVNTLRKLKQTVLIEIDNALRGAELAAERVNASDSAQRLANEAVEAEEKKLSTGRSTTFIVLLLQNNLTEARLQKVLADAQYERALVQLALAEGSILQRHEISIE